jgi:hypothetical protein
MIFFSLLLFLLIHDAHVHWNIEFYFFCSTSTLLVSAALYPNLEPWVENIEKASFVRGIGLISEIPRDRNLAWNVR